MRVRAAVLTGAILVGCGGARNNGGGTAAVTSQVTTPPPADPSASSTSATPSSPPAPPPDNTPTPAPPPAPPTPRAWAGTQVFTTPWTEVDGAAILPRARLLVHGSQFLVNNGIGGRRGTLAWTDASAKVDPEPQVP